MASPSAPWRPWPTCSGPVGLAETNSTIMRCPRAGRWPKRSPEASTSRTTSCLAEGFGHLARCALQGLGQLHSHRGGQVAMRGDLGGFKDSAGTCTRQGLLKHGGQRLEQFGFDRQHALILRATRPGALGLLDTVAGEASRPGPPRVCSHALQLVTRGALHEKPEAVVDS